MDTYAQLKTVAGSIRQSILKRSIPDLQNCGSSTSYIVHWRNFRENFRSRENSIFKINFSMRVTKYYSVCLQYKWLMFINMDNILIVLLASFLSISLLISDSNVRIFNTLIFIIFSMKINLPRQILN